MSSRRKGYYGPNLMDLTVGAVCVIAMVVLAVLAVALFVYVGGAV